ncbi:MAG: hypothetical protein KG029_17025 [Bacteroidetes bacterium]|nr:hypothetical protein [Bacteroidota bacterium]
MGENMSKFAKFFISVFILAAFLFASAGPAFAAGERSITLISAGVVPGKGVVFTFQVKGDFDSFGGTVRVGGQDFYLACNFRDDGVLSCTMNQGGGKYAGQMAQVSLNGYAFSAVIRPGTYCYSVYDYEFGNPSVWEFIGTHCQDNSAENGGIIEFYNDYGYDDWYDYMYMDPSILPCVDFGAGFYYPSCPSNPT